MALFHVAPSEKAMEYHETSRKHVKIVSSQQQEQRTVPAPATAPSSNGMTCISNGLNRPIAIFNSMPNIFRICYGYPTIFRVDYCVIITTIVMLINKNGFCDLRQKGFSPTAFFLSLSLSFQRNSHFPERTPWHSVSTLLLFVASLCILLRYNSAFSRSFPFLHSSCVPFTHSLSLSR